MMRYLGFRILQLEIASGPWLQSRGVAADEIHRRFHIHQQHLKRPNVNCQSTINN